METERRNFTLDSLEVRRKAGEVPRIRGYAAVFDALSDDLGGFRERIDPGAFAGSIEGDVRGLFNHDPNFILGRTTSGTLRLWTDDHGLGYEAEPPATQWAKDLMVSIDRGDITNASFAFRTPPGGDEWQTKGGQTTRTLKTVELLDVSTVTFPAYPQASAAVRAYEDYRKGQKDPGDPRPSGYNRGAKTRQFRAELYS
jgi:HK97 family phage prohead protease